MGRYEDQRKQQTRRRRFETRILLDRLKQKPCTDCGLNLHPCQMDLVGGNGKPMSSFLLKSKRKIIEELEKRELVCANCHRLRIWNKQRQDRMEPT